MRLISKNSASVELLISGYQFPDHEATNQRDWDANWLNVSGTVRQADGKIWSFEDPSLTIWEAQELGTWLRDIAAGTMTLQVGANGPGQELLFTEPNLEFSLESRVDDRVRLLVRFHLEALPPWVRGERWSPGVSEHSVLVEVSTAELANAAETWMRELQEYPER